jgi:hypothetical protein
MQVFYNTWGKCDKQLANVTCSLCTLIFCTSTSLRNNWCTISFTYLKCTMWFFYHMVYKLHLIKDLSFSFMVFTFTHMYICCLGHLPTPHMTALYIFED